MVAADRRCDAIVVVGIDRLELSAAGVMITIGIMATRRSCCLPCVTVSTRERDWRGLETRSQELTKGSIY
jgi:hypothetical protein